GIRPLMAEEAIGLGEKLQETRRVPQDAGEPHDRELTQRIEQPAAGLGHVFAAEADAFHRRVAEAQLADQVGAVQVAARLAGAEEDSHGFPAFALRRMLPGCRESKVGIYGSDRPSGQATENREKRKPQTTPPSDSLNHRPWYGVFVLAR